jgi:hypothetical protein
MMFAAFNQEPFRLPDFDFALSALHNRFRFLPGPLAQAFTFRAFGAQDSSFHTGSVATGSSCYQLGRAYWDPVATAPGLTSSLVTADAS